MSVSTPILVVSSVLLLGVLGGVLAGSVAHPKPKSSVWNGFQAIATPPTETAQEAARSRAYASAMREVRRLSESGDAQGALRLLNANVAEMDPRQKSWNVLNNRVWSDVLLRAGEFRTILAAYSASGSDPRYGVPPAVTIADLETDGRADLPHAGSRTSLRRFVAKRIVDDLPSDATPKGLLTLAYLAVGQDYHAEANFQASRWYFERAARLMPHDPFCAWSLGEDLNELGVPAAAVAAMRRADLPKTPGLKTLLDREIALAQGLSAAAPSMGAVKAARLRLIRDHAPTRP